MARTLTGHLKSFVYDSKTGWFMNKLNVKIILNTISENSINTSPQIFTTYHVEFYIHYYCQSLCGDKNDSKI